jgi:hypothetical protein
MQSEVSSDKIEETMTLVRPRGILFIALALVVLLNGSTEQIDPIVPTKDQIVTVDLQVLDKNSTAPITNLGQQDFELIANGRRIPVARVSFGNAPIDLVLVLDEPTLEARTGQSLLKAMCSALALNWRPEDKLGAIRVASESLSRTPLSRDVSTVERDLLAHSDEVPRRSSIADGIRASLDLLRDNAVPQLYRRQAVLIVTRNQHSLDEHAIRAVQERALRDGVTVYECTVATTSLESGQRKGIFLPGMKFKGPKSKVDWSSIRSFQPIVDATGGETIMSEELDAYAVQHCFSRIKERYLVSFKPRLVNDSQRQTIEISVKSQAVPRSADVVLRYRSTFWSD